MKALALIDGEHYAEVVVDALRDLPYDVVGAVALGGTEKLRGGEDYGVPLFDSLADGLARSGAEIVVDLSDEPVVTARDRFRLASQTLAAGVPYTGADFRFDPVEFAPLDAPALAVIGAGKRVGKTAASGHVARLLSQTRDVVVVAMGRGGPPEPVLVEEPPGLAELLARSRAGSHAASDYLEDAALARVTTIGARRCGGGLAGAPYTSNVEEAARMAAERRPDIVLLEGSGTAIPPVEAGARVLVAGASQDPELVAGYLGAYRVLLSDLVVITGGDSEALRAAIADVKPVPVIATRFRPAPAAPVDGRRVAVFTTAPERAHGEIREELERAGADVELVSGNLADREALREDVRRAGADVFLIEIKAAAIDVVAEAAAQRGAEVVFLGNAVEPLPGEPDLDAELVRLADQAALVAGAAL